MTVMMPSSPSLPAMTGCATGCTTGFLLRAATSAAIAVRAMPACTRAAPCSRTMAHSAAASGRSDSPRASAQSNPGPLAATRGETRRSASVRWSNGGTSTPLPTSAPAASAASAPPGGLGPETASALDAAPVGQAGIQRQTKVIWRDGQYDTRSLVPPRSTHAHIDGGSPHSRRIGERPPMPLITVGQDSLGHPKRGHGRARRQRDESAATLVRCPRETHRLGPLRLDSSEHDQCKPATTQEPLAPPQCIDPLRRTHEERPLGPEWTGGTAPIDPRRAFTGREQRVTGGAENGHRPTLRHPRRQPPARKPSSRKRPAQPWNSHRDQLRRMLRNRDRIGKSMAEQGAELSSSR